ncbi:MBL fold metallo-hydrolase [Massilia sp. CF038]|uniref:MBL fold metallo-hydrolase n=1 Tax=Massilia sp. CF038 TaxID=1881045 RepID=UPI000916DBEE|nr:MBL fold metallo-hydrolase [Massilia sp. CF038]SHH17654.1 L-ascorbate metabolism protein UlaG, beta-lactamase superfamily [Massilia sp. CF038]
MHITQLRNATIIIQTGAHRILVDPMLAPKGALPPLRLFDGKRLRNPLLDLPDVAEAALAGVTHCLITHCQKGHFDHLDRAGKRFLRERAIPVFCSANDAPYLRARGLHVQALAPADAVPVPFLEGSIQTVRCTHGEGWVGRIMEHGVGYLIRMPGEPSLYLSGDTILSQTVRAFVLTHQPQVCVIPAGGARLDLGGEIIMGPDEALAFAQLATGAVIANHLEALSHCPPTRAALAQAARACGLGARLLVPGDGETLAFTASGAVATRVTPAR